MAITLMRLRLQPEGLRAPKCGERHATEKDIREREGSRAKGRYKEGDKHTLKWKSNSKGAINYMEKVS
jgi:hypothetical protein